MAAVAAPFCPLLIAPSLAVLPYCCHVQEAQELWERVREKQGGEKFKPEVEEEYEDREGNVYDKRTYNDLKKQGLI